MSDQKKPSIAQQVSYGPNIGHYGAPSEVFEAHFEDLENKYASHIANKKKIFFDTLNPGDLVEILSDHLGVKIYDPTNFVPKIISPTILRGSVLLFLGTRKRLLSLGAVAKWLFKENVFEADIPTRKLRKADSKQQGKEGGPPEKTKTR